MKKICKDCGGVTNMYDERHTDPRDCIVELRETINAILERLSRNNTLAFIKSINELKK